MTGRPLRAAIVGTGGISRQHHAGYVAAGVPVVALADPDPVARARRAEEWGVTRTFATHAELLAEPDIDCISVSAPNAVHAAVTIAAAASGRHVLCEKPISLSPAEGERMIAACADAGVVLQVNHHLRANPAVARARAMLDAGPRGRITFLRFRQAHDWGGASEVGPTFRTRALAGGGTLLDNGCHLFDLARHLGGDVTHAWAQGATLGFAAEVEDTATASLRFASGALGHVETQWTATGWEMSFAVYGTRGALEYSDRSGRPILRHLHRAPGNDSWGDVSEQTWSDPAGSDHTRAVAAFIAAVRGERPALCTGEDGLAAVAIALACYRSFASGALEPVG
ncbi:MAG: Gfo/Idh/MocA family protein [Chloroflexota bacterium]